jgi:myo-inositol catabolism protein IolC
MLTKEILKILPFLYREESACSTEKCCSKLKEVWEDCRNTKKDLLLSFWVLLSSSPLKNRARGSD